jgi:hypothetical protein
MIEILGIIGTVCFAISGAPVALQTVKENKCLVPIFTALCVFIGSLTMYFYLFFQNGFDIIVFLDYWITIICWFIPIYYKLILNK